MDAQSENVMLEEERVGDRLEDERLRKRMRRIVISPQLTQYVDQNSSVKHRLTVHFGDDVLDLLKCEAL